MAFFRPLHSGNIFYFLIMEFKMKKSLLITLCLLLLTGCASTGNQQLGKQTNVSLNEKITNGKTTRNQIEALLGQPDNIDFSESNNEKWTYVYQKSKSKIINFIPVANMINSGTNDQKKRLVIVFNQKGIVQRHALSESNGQTNVGWLA